MPVRHTEVDCPSEGEPAIPLWCWVVLNICGAFWRSVLRTFAEVGVLFSNFGCTTS